MLRPRVSNERKNVKIFFPISQASGIFSRKLIKRKMRNSAKIVFRKIIQRKLINCAKKLVEFYALRLSIRSFIISWLIIDNFSSVFFSQNFRIFLLRNIRTSYFAFLQNKLKRNFAKKKFSGKMRNLCVRIYPFRWKPYLDPFSVV